MAKDETEGLKPPWIEEDGREQLTYICPGWWAYGINIR